MVFGEYEKPPQSKDRGVGWLLVNQNRVGCLAAHNVQQQSDFVNNYVV